MPDPDTPSSAPVVYVDAEPFSWKWFAGVPRYTARLVMTLAKTGPVRFFHLDHEIVLPDRLSFDANQDLEAWGRRIWQGERRELPADRDGLAGLYSGFRIAKRRFPFEIAVLYDLCPLVVGWTTTDAARSGFEKYFSEHIGVSDAAIAISHSSKADAAWLCPMPQERIHVAHPGPSLCVDGRHHHPAPVERSSNIGLAVSTVEPRKNAPFVVDWFHKSRVLPPDAELWWVGKMGWLVSPEELEAMANPPGGRRVRFLGNVGDAELCELYKRAAWSIYPSVYEGFGFPVLDALMHGAPVLTGRNSSLREFDHPGVHFFDACDPSSVDEAWLSLSAAGPTVAPDSELSRIYDWDSVARLIRSLVSERRPPGRLPSDGPPRPHLPARMK